MPVVINRTSTARPVSPRKRQFDAAVKELAPIIIGIRNGGVRDVRGIMRTLHEQGVKAPNAQCFSYGRTLRVLKRIAELRLGEGPRTRSAAATARPHVFRRRRSRISTAPMRALRACRMEAESDTNSGERSC